METKSILEKYIDEILARDRGFADLRERKAFNRTFYAGLGEEITSSIRSEISRLYAALQVSL